MSGCGGVVGAADRVIFRRVDICHHLELNSFTFHSFHSIHSIPYSTPIFLVYIALPVISRHKYRGRITLSPRSVQSVAIQQTSTYYRQ